MIFYRITGRMVDIQIDQERRPERDFARGIHISLYLNPLDNFVNHIQTDTGISLSIRIHRYTYSAIRVKIISFKTSYCFLKSFHEQ